MANEKYTKGPWEVDYLDRTTTYIFENGITTKTVSDQPEPTRESYAQACRVIRDAAKRYVHEDEHIRLMRRKRIEFKPDYAIAPGTTLLETIQSLGISQVELARRTGRPLKTINEIIKGKAAITAETALQLEHVLGMPASFWNNLERNYRQALASL
jgi:addiction module HigA family antidote